MKTLVLMSRIARKTVLLFVKAPIAGKVKTRLGGRFAPDTVASLYRGFVADFLANLEPTGHDIRIYYDPPKKRAEVAGWLGGRYPLFPQVDGDLGTRMKAAFAETFAAGYTRAVLVGSDIPDLPVAIIEEAIEALGRCPASIGPTDDGGYYLIGFNSEDFEAEVFDGIAWSTDRVFASTLDRFDKLNRAVHRLPLWRDIDSHEDLVDLARRIRGQPARLPITRIILSRLGLL